MPDYILSFAVALVVTAVSGLFLIPALRRLKFGQSILDIGPKWHKSKQGTPTMGGFMFMIGISVAVFAVGFPYMLDGNWGHVFVLLFAWIFGIIGFIDGFQKVKKRQNLGITALQKLFLQLAVGAALIALLRYFGYLTEIIYIPYVNVSIPMPFVLYAFISLLLVAGMVNAVNLTDGIDGLCSGVTLPIAVLFAVLGWQWEKGELGIFAMALAGGLVGFLIYNKHPAKVFMGDTGSLFLGGAVAGLGFVFDMPVLMIFVGLAYIFEMFSVIIQVLYFKATKGKRFFKMSPFHHHLEMSKWSEWKIFAAFVSVTAILCVIGYFGVANGR